MAGFLLVCAILFFPVYLDENYLSCITSQKDEFYVHQKVTTMEVHQEWSVGEEKLLMCHLCEINSVNATAMPEIVYETVFGNITKEKGSVIFINMLLLIAGVESNPGPTGLQPMDLDDLYKEDINEEKGKYRMKPTFFLKKSVCKIAVVLGFFT